MISTVLTLACAKGVRTSHRASASRHSMHVHTDRKQPCVKPSSNQSPGDWSDRSDILGAECPTGDWKNSPPPPPGPAPPAPKAPTVVTRTGAGKDRDMYGKKLGKTHASARRRARRRAASWE